ncbi:MAG: beta-ketoacyl synthase N-terminal-like domain-containing protein [Patescibacteria group bacterium]
MDTPIIIGTGHTKFCHTSQTIEELMRAASREALDQANLTINDIDAVYVANFSSRFVSQCHLPALAARALGFQGEVTRIESACASGGLAVKQAAISLWSRLYNRILVIGAEKMSQTPLDVTTQILASAAAPEEQRVGTTFPSLFALMAQAYMSEHHASETHLAHVAVKNHEHALQNPLAQFHKHITVSDVLASRVIASPLKLYDCAPISDGAAAIVLANPAKAPSKTKLKIQLKGIGHVTMPIGITCNKPIFRMPAVTQAVKTALNMAEMRLNHIHFMELHDCFTIAELLQMEALGVCPPGQAKNWVAQGKTRYDGLLPINVSGGLKAKGHAIGATGVSQIVAVARQLSGLADGIQLQSIRCGLACNIGGTGSSAVVSILTS